ncbi:MAG TPA: SPOR domain-containing protein [Pseudolabrys sp.]|nr:SPOR domain-containing protein [Pseudolabrys sp.]
MADDSTAQRAFRSNDPYSRNATPGSVEAPANDPLAELARLIGQNDPFAEFGSEARRPTASPTQAQPAYRMDAREPHGGPAPSHSQHDDASYAASPNPDDHDADYYQDEMQAPPEDYYAEPSSSRRRVGIMAIAGVFALGVIGTAGAFGYRALFGPGGSSMPPPVIKADTSPSKIVPQTGTDAKAGGKVIYDRVGDRGQGEKVVSREETPLDIKSKSNGVIPPAAAGDENGAAGAMQAMAGDASFTEPKRIHTIVIRPDQPDMGLPAPAPAPSASAPPAPPPPRVASVPQTRVANAQPQQAAPDAPSRHAASTPQRAEPAAHHGQAAPQNAPLSLSPGGSANSPARQPTRVANAPAAAVPARSGAAHGEYVQVSSQRSETDAQASFRTLQGKYPKQLGGRQLVIHRADLGAKGIYYRALVGPFASANEAVQLCSSLKAAGGSCLIQRN